MHVLVLSADIGAGHDEPARWLAAGLRERTPAATVSIVDTLQVCGPTIRRVVRGGSDVLMDKGAEAFDRRYRMAMRRPTRYVGDLGMPLLAGRRLRQLVTDLQADLVVSTYPLASYVLGVLRAQRRLAVPVASAITDLSALRYWAHRGVDLHLLVHAESDAEVRQLAGPNARTVAVRGLSDAGFDVPQDAAAARVALALPVDRPLIVVSGGGWGVGDLVGAVTTARGAAPAATIVVLCGRNADAFRAVQDGFAGDSATSAWGFTDRMGELLAAADVLVHSTAGLTAFEAMIRGTRVISYGWGMAHIRSNNEAYDRFGLARVATDRLELAVAVRDALGDPRRPLTDYGARPSAADAVLSLLRPV